MLPKCKSVMLFFATYDDKLNSFGFLERSSRKLKVWRQMQILVKYDSTKQAIKK